MTSQPDPYHRPDSNYSEYDCLQVTQDDEVYICAFDDPDTLNAMSYAQMSEFNDFLTKVRWDDNCRAIVLTGNGRAFCAGFNLDDLALEPPEGMGRIQRDFYVMQRMCSEQIVNLRKLEQPVIGALKGFAVGGGLSLACACDMRILGESFSMSAGYLNIGYTGTDMGGSYYLPKIVGLARAAEILMTGRRFKARQLSDWGFASRVVADDDVVPAAKELAHEITSHSAPFGLRLTRESLLASLEGTSFETVVKMENRNQVLAANTSDGINGVKGMRDRNPIEFHNE